MIQAHARQRLRFAPGVVTLQPVAGDAVEQLLGIGRADALVASGDVDGAQRLEDQAAAASARYDDPSSPTTLRRDLHRTLAR